jgi:hypothetical protein
VEVEQHDQLRMGRQRTFRKDRRTSDGIPDEVRPAQDQIRNLPLQCLAPLVLRDAFIRLTGPSPFGEFLELARQQFFLDFSRSYGLLDNRENTSAFALRSNSSPAPL